MINLIVVTVFKADSSCESTVYAIIKPHERIPFSEHHEHGCVLTLAYGRAA